MSPDRQRGLNEGVRKLWYETRDNASLKYKWDVDEANQGAKPNT